MKRNNSNKKKWDPAATPAGPGVMVGRCAASFAPFVLTGGHKGRGPRPGEQDEGTASHQQNSPGNSHPWAAAPGEGMAPGRTQDAPPLRPAPQKVLRGISAPFSSCFSEADPFVFSIYFIC